MKKKKLIKIIMVFLMLIPFTVVNAATKTEQIVESLKESVKSYDGTVKYENDTIEIEWNIPNSKSEEVSFSYNGNIIEYDPGEITNYDEAVEATSHTIYSMYLIETALRLNGYSEEKIKDFFAGEGNNFDYEINGIEFKEIGESKSYTSQDGTTTITAFPYKIKIDVTKANLNKTSDDTITPKSTTIDDVIEYLQSDKEFTTTESEGKVVFENQITSDDEYITINHTYYWDDYYNVFFDCVDDVITYEDGEITNYAEAESALSHQMFATQIISNALKMNGYTTEEIQKFFSSETSELNYELNGIEFQKNGESKEFTSSDGLSKVNVTPMKIKVDLNKANIKTVTEEKTKKYNVLEGANKTFALDKEITFRFDIEYSKFKENGKVYIDGELVDSSNYTSKEGSTVITLNNNYAKKLSAKDHTLKVTVADGDVETKFTIKNKINNPQTGDNILLYVSLLGFSIVGLVGLVLYTKRKKNN